MSIYFIRNKSVGISLNRTLMEIMSLIIQWSSLLS